MLMSVSMRSLLITLVCLLSVFRPAFAAPSDVELDKRAYQLYQQVLSPFCAGRSLNDCPSSKAHDLKIQLRQRLAAGDSEEVILADFLKEFGEKYRAVPEYSGFGLLAWWMPIAFLAWGAIVALRLAVSKGGKEAILGSELEKSAEVSGPERSVSEELRREIEAELRRIE
jgi:cytochrome c-type biogenesis protein CcmH